MKSVYVGIKRSNEQIAVAVDISAIAEDKTVGAFLKLMAEAGLLVDRVDRDEVIFEEPKMEPSYLKDNQLKIDWTQESGGGPSDMPEGFVCNFSGECPTPGKPCSNCEHAGSMIPAAKVVEPDPEKDEFETCPVCNGSGVNAQNAAEFCAECNGSGRVRKAEAPTLVDELLASPMMEWTENEVGEPIEVPAELLAEGDPMNDPVIDGKIEDGPTAEELDKWEDATYGSATESEPDEHQEAEELPF
jgi:hypothetical protein